METENTPELSLSNKEMEDAEAGMGKATEAAIKADENEATATQEMPAQEKAA